MILGTRQRPGAAIAMKRAQFFAATMMALDGKNDEIFETGSPARLHEFAAQDRRK